MVVATPRGEELRWEGHQVGLQRWREGRRCGLQVVHRLPDVSIASGSGWRSRRGCRARMLLQRPVCLRPWEDAGSVKVVACEQSVRPRCRGATCRLPSARRSRSSGPRARAAERSPADSGAQRRRSHVSCAAMPRRGAVGWSIERARHSGMPTDARSVRRLPSWPATSSSSATFRNGYRARSSGPTVGRWLARRCAGLAVDTDAGSTDAGPRRGAPSRSRTG